MIFASASVGGGLAITPASTVCFTPSCQWPIFVVQLLFGSEGFLSASPPGSCFIFVALLALTPGSCGAHARTHVRTHVHTHARAPPSVFFNELKCLIHINLPYWFILLNCSLSANQEARYVRCKHQNVHVWSRNVSYFLGALLQGQSMNEDQPLSPEYW